MIKFLLNILRPFKLLIFGQVTVAIFWAVDLSLRPYLLKLMVDRLPNVQAADINQQLLPLIVFYLIMSLLLVIMFRFYDFIWLQLNPRLKRHVGDILVKMMMDHSITLFQNQFAGNLANKVKDVMSGIPDLVKLVIQQFFSNFLAVCIAVFAVWTISSTFSFLLLGWVLIFTAGSALFVKKAKLLCEDSAAIRSKVVGYMVDIFSNILAKKNESSRLMLHLDDYVIADQKRDWWFLWMFLFQGLSFVFYQVLVFMFLVSGFKVGTITPGDFALLVSVNISLISTLWSLSADILNFSDIVGNLKQGLQIALAPIEILDKPNAVALNCYKGQTTFDNVKFHYKGTEPLFQNKSIEIKAGQKVGLVGYSGGGKSTFVNLILRLYDVTDGAILIDGQDIRDVTQDSLRENIAMIPQDPSLFHRSLMENIRYGRADSTDEEVIEAAKKAHAHEFISTLPQGYDSLVGERGVKLSGGQRQRIAIARAILKNAPILILDEATSQLDSVTESLIQASLWELMQNKTTIVIAHRLSTLLHMDRILVFDKGKIVEDGTHSELLSRAGLYKHLWDAQVGGFLGDEKTEGEA